MQKGKRMDLIDRQAAIDAVMNTKPVVFDVQHLEPHQKTKDVVDAIEKLPSAAMDLDLTCNNLMSDLISRQDLFDELNDSGVPYNAEVNRIINAMPTATQWIPCGACIHYTALGNSFGRCAFHGSKMCNDNDFCSWAERKGKE